MLCTRSLQLLNVTQLGNEFTLETCESVESVRKKSDSGEERITALTFSATNLLRSDNLQNCVDTDNVIYDWRAVHLRSKSRGAQFFSLVEKKTTNALSKTAIL